MEQPEELEYQVYREFEVLEKIGKGTYGIVYKAVNKKTKKIFAIKKIIDAFQNLIDAKRTYRELNYLLQLEHPSIIRLNYLLSMGRKGGPQQPTTARLAPPSQEIRGCNTDKLAQNPYTQQRHVYAVFQYAETDMRVVLKRCPELQLIQRKFISYQLLQGIAYLHRSGLVHRDIKPQNLLLNCNKLQLKICDFGMARLQASSAGNQGVLTQYVASRWYRPPEALLGISTCQPSIDLWSVGCVLAQFALGSPLFPGKSTLDQLQLIFRSIGLPSPFQIQKLQSQQAQYVIKNFSFSRKARNKPLKDTLINCCPQQIDLISKLLMFDPNHRISAQSALQHPFFEQVRGLNQELELFSKAKVNVKDCSEKYVNEKGEKVSLGIEDYRGLIEQLQKFIEKSTNHSAPINRRGNLQGQHFVIGKDLLQEGGNELLKEKSTKESNFVAENKQHFLKRAQEDFTKKSKIENCQNGLMSNMRTIEKSKNQDSKKKDILKQQKISSCQSVQLKEKIADKISKKSKPKMQKEQMTQEKKNKNKDKKREKSQIIERQKSCKNRTSFKGSIPQQRTDKNLKKTKGSQASLRQAKSPFKPKDNLSIISNHSKASSNRSKSVERSKSKQKMQNTTSIVYGIAKEDVVKRMIKPSIHQNKSGLVKCKSANQMNFFRK